jgi:Putative Actinobacterial Holin-X, holin superfamily III
MEVEKMPEKLARAGDAAPSADQDWSSLAGRAIDDISRIIQSEIGLFETTMKVALEEQTDYALANLATVAVMICAAICMLGALLLFLHQWLQWWLALAAVGLVASVVGIAIHATVGRRVAVRRTPIKGRSNGS